MGFGDIVAAKVVGIREAENTIAGTTINSTYYSVLYETESGNKYMVEGELNKIEKYVPYMNVRDGVGTKELEKLLEEHEKRIAEHFDRKLQAIVNSIYTVPEIIGLGENEAVKLLTDNRFVVIKENTYPEGAPEGFVKSWKHDPDNIKNILLDIRHTVPEVIGLSAEEAVEKLTEAGYHVTVEQKYGDTMEEQNNTVTESVVTDEFKMEVRITEYKFLSDVKNMTREDAAKLLEGAGFKVELQDAYSQDVEKGKVVSWTKDGDTATLLISIGNDPAEGGAAQVNITSDGAYEFSIKKGCAKLDQNQFRKAIVITFEMRVNSKNSFYMPSRLTAPVGGASISGERVGFSGNKTKVGANEALATMYSYEITIYWYISDDEKLPETADFGFTMQSGGLIKKTNNFKIHCDMKWEQ